MKLPPKQESRFKGMAVLLNEPPSSKGKEWYTKKEK